MAAIGYDETLTSGIDNDFALRSLRSGLVWQHTGRVLTMRRLHPEQITIQLSEGQLGNARSAYAHFTYLATPWTMAKLRKGRGPADYVSIADRPEELVPFLPDHLVTRSLTGEVGRAGPSDGTFVCTASDGSTRYFVQNGNVTWQRPCRNAR